MEIVKYPAPILYKKVLPIEEVNDEVKEIAEQMVVAMHEANGVGLAGPQVGLNKSIIIVNETGEKDNDQVYLNPRIVKKSKKGELGEEGCLSLPGLFGNVKRSTWIQVEATLLSGEEVTFEAEDFHARVLQHEIDHLNGVLFITKVQPAEKTTLKGKLKQMEQEYNSGA